MNYSANYPKVDPPETGMYSSGQITNAYKNALRGKPYAETTDGRILRLHDPMSRAKECHDFVMDALAGKYDFNSLAVDLRRTANYHSKLRITLGSLRRFPSLYTPGFQYHPAISFLFEQYRLHPIAQFGEIETPSFMLRDGSTVADVFQNFIAVMKIRAVETGLRKKISNHEGKIKKNLRRLKEWEDELFRRCSRPVIIRIDLEYLASLIDAKACIDTSAESLSDRLDYNAIFQSGDSLEGRALPAMFVGFDEVQADRQKLFDNIKGKPSLFKYLIGYVWRIEHSLKTGYHIHLVLAFDGAHVRKHEWLAQKIGEYWKDQVTAGRGRFHNCNRDWKSSSPRYGIGVVPWNDDGLRVNLRKHVLSYLAKVGQHVLALPYKGCKLMCAGFVHRDKGEARGRPRSTSHEAKPASRPDKSRIRFG